MSARGTADGQTCADGPLRRRTPHAPRRARAETAARRRRLLEAAVELATEGGYDAVQMRDVAARAQVALGTLYRHYSSKDQLLLAALADQAGTLRTRLAQRPPRGDDPGDRVADVLRARDARADRATRAITAAMVTALSSPEPQAAAAKGEVYEHPPHDHQRRDRRRTRCRDLDGDRARARLRVARDARRVGRRA